MSTFDAILEKLQTQITDTVNSTKYNPLQELVNNKVVVTTNHDIIYYGTFINKHGDELILNDVKVIRYSEPFTEYIFKEHNYKDMIDVLTKHDVHIMAIKNYNTVSSAPTLLVEYLK